MTYEVQTYSCSILTNVSTMRPDGVKFELLPYYIVDGYAPLPKNFYTLSNANISLVANSGTNSGSVSVTTFAVG